MSGNYWWGYKHKEGTLQAKRYFGNQDLEEAYSSPFVETVVGPFRADGRDEALNIIKTRLEGGRGEVS